MSVVVVIALASSGRLLVGGGSRSGRSARVCLAALLATLVGSGMALPIGVCVFVALGHRELVFRLSGWKA